MTAPSSSTPTLIRFTDTFRCPICGGSPNDTRGASARCWGYMPDERYARCSREEYARGLEKNSDDTYSHFLGRQGCRCGVVHSAEADRASVARLQSKAYYARQRSGGPAPAPAPRPPSTIKEVYRYEHEDGSHAFDVCRMEPKDFRQRKPDGSWGIKGIRRVLYRLPKLKGQRKVYVVEGERDVGSLEALGLVATTCAMGAGKWSEEYTTQLVRAGVEEVVVVPDQDEPGEKHAHDVARSLLRAGLKVKVVNVQEPYKDVSEAIAAGYGKASLLRAEMTASFLAPGDLPSAERFQPSGRPLAEIDYEEVQWVWRDYLARGSMTVVAGDPGLGKSKVTLDLAARHSRGLRWPDRTSGAEGATILLTAEDNLASTVKPRLEAMHADCSKVFALEATRDHGEERHVSLDTDVPALEQYIEATGADLVIIDPLSAYLGKVDSHNDAELRRVLGPVSKLAERTRVAIVGVMHLTKAQDRMALMRLQGSVAFGAAARVVLGVVPDQDVETRRLLVPLKSNLGPRPAALAFDPTRGLGIEWEGAPVTDLDVERLFRSEDADEAPARRDAEDFLRQTLAGGAQRAEVVKASAKSAGIAPRTLDRAKRAIKVRAELRGGGVGEVGSAWYWSLPACGGDGA